MSLLTAENSRRISAVSMPSSIDKEIASPRGELYPLLAGDWFWTTQEGTPLLSVSGGVVVLPKTGQRTTIAEDTGANSAGDGKSAGYVLEWQGQKVRGEVSKFGGTVTWSSGDIWKRNMASSNKRGKQSIDAMSRHYVDTVLNPLFTERCLLNWQDINETKAT